MPATDIYLAPNERAREELGGDRERKDRDKIYKDNFKYYSGDQEEWLIQDDDDPVNDNVTINVTKQSIDRTLSFLFPDLPVFQLDANADTANEEWLNNVWLMNGGAYLLSTLAQYGALSGHCYARVMQAAIGDVPRIVPINPCVPVTYWKADDFQTVVWHEFKYSAGKTETIIDFVNNGNNWTIYRYTKDIGGQTYILDNTEQWGYRVSPVIDWQHLPEPGKYYGRPEITANTKQLNDYINRVASDIGKILRYHASPKTVATGTDNIAAADGIEGMYLVPDPAAKVYNVEMQSDLSSSMSFLNYLNDAYLTLARVVVMKGTVKDFQRVTNTGIRAVFLDMIAKNQTLRWTYGTGMQKLSQAILFRGNKAVVNTPSVVWTDPLPTDQLELVNQLAIEQGNGWNDPESISKQLGNEWGVVAKNWANLPEPIKTLILGNANNPNGGVATRAAKQGNPAN